MNRRYFCSLLCFMAISGGVWGQTSSIEGAGVMKTDETQVFSVPADNAVTVYHWQVPSGCRITAGQGTNSVEVTSTWLARAGRISVERTFADERRDTIYADVSFMPFVKEFKDYTIAPGESVEIGGIERSEADIYYTPAEDGDGYQVVAHRLTVEPVAGDYVDITKPYLQTAGSNSIWISWKTSFATTPSVRFGKDSSALAESVEGTTEDLSEDGFPYYWHSVHLTGLEPNTIYYYQTVSGDRGESEVYRFRTMPEPGSKTPMRILLQGDHQIKSRSGYEWLLKASQRKIMEKYGDSGDMTENINMIMNIGDQVDVASLDQYEQIHLFKSQQVSPYLPIMTAVGNHDTYNDTGMRRYAAHYHYEDLEYQGIKSGTENYYAYQAGRILFVVLSTEHTGNEQKAWVRRIVDAAKDDDSVDFIISVNHRPIQAEQYIGDISSWVRNEIIPILCETPKHVFNYGGHHHLYHRGQLTEWPLYHIINGAASWDQMWGMSSEQDYPDVQKTIDYWGYQILEFDFEKKEMKAECYAIGNKELVVDNILIDSFSRTLGKAAPERPEVMEVPEVITLPYTFEGSDYATTTDSPLNTVQYQFSFTDDFATIDHEEIVDIEDLYGSTGSPLHIPIDLNEGRDITKLTVENNQLKNGLYYVRLRYRDANMEWSEWSEPRSFTVEGSIDGDPAISLEDNSMTPGEQIVINYEYAPEGQNAWIGIYRKGENPNTNTGGALSYRWNYTPSQSGTMTFTIDEVNEYYVVLFEDEGYTEITERLPFYVGPEIGLSLDKTSFAEGEDIAISYTNAPGMDSDWIGIYRMGEVPGTADTSDSWDYLNGQTEGTLTLTEDLPKGYYFVNYFLKGQYFEPRERLFFSIGDMISTVSTDKTLFTTDEDIVVHYQDGPGTPKDWVGVFAEGEDPNVDELDAFLYTYGATDGDVTIEAGALKPGDYFCALFINDSYDEVSPRIHFTVESVSGIDDAARAATVVYPNPAGDVLHVVVDEATDAVICDMIGSQVMRASLVAGDNTLSLGSLMRGVYLLRLDGGKVCHKIVKG